MAVSKFNWAVLRPLTWPESDRLLKYITFFGAVHENVARVIIKKDTCQKGLGMSDNIAEIVLKAHLIKAALPGHFRFLSWLRRSQSHATGKYK
jgi:hypothetical protein